MSGDVLAHITCPDDVKRLSDREVAQLAQDLRAEMIAATSLNGGHLASSLGAVELILAAYRVLDLPHDKLVFDVGHQAYAHKMLTGRLSGFAKLRQIGGVSGFTRRSESPYDVHDSGHASDSVAVALGLAEGRDLRGSDERILTIIGDASIGGGLAMEALNVIGQRRKRRFVIILNDNEMSISHTTGAISSYLASIRTSQRYIATRDALEDALSKTDFGAGLVKLGELAKASTKQLLVPGMFFEELGFVYLGPIDGHNVALVQETISRAFDVDGPVVIHAVTRKGKGYAPAENNPELFHGIGPFDPKTGLQVKKPASAPTYTSVFARSLEAEAEKDERIFAITAAMKGGTGLTGFAERFPRRFIDVGIAEECAVTMAAGLAIDGEVPVVAIYSTFLQRAFDEIVTNVCLPNLHVVFAVDRAGLVGQDGSTHHGVFDIAYLRALPNMRIIAPSDEAELADAIHTAIAMDGPVAVRYPRGSGTGAQVSPVRRMLPVRSEKKRDGADVRILALGNMVSVACEAAEILEGKSVSCGVRDMRWVKPLDVEAIREECASSARLIVTVEDAAVAAGFGSAVLESMADNGLSVPVLRLGIPDEFVGHGSTDELLSSIGLDARGIAASIEKRLEELAKSADSSDGRAAN
jgi:1-deoxy-D-xylulose-5-phosphate synthase